MMLVLHATARYPFTGRSAGGRFGMRPELLCYIRNIKSHQVFESSPSGREVGQSVLLCALSIQVVIMTSVHVRPKEGSCSVPQSCPNLCRICTKPFKHRPDVAKKHCNVAEPWYTAPGGTTHSPETR